MSEGDFDFNITVVGLGLIGGSYAKALSNLNLKRLYGVDINKESLDNALKMGIIDEGFTDGSIALKKSHLIIIALYPNDAIKFIQDNVQNLKQGSIITDTCGLKQDIIERATRILPDTIEFVGGHPIAGKESQGFECSSEKIFLDTNYIITPTQRNTEKNIKLIENMAKAIGCKNVVRVSPAKHDKIISLTSQLPHIIAITLMNSYIDSDIGNSFIGGSYKDATRVATINTKLWIELITQNSDNLVIEIEKFENTLAKLKQAIKGKDNSTLGDILASSSLKRKRMLVNENAKH
jgi:prephenate dehydrogenase